MFRDWASVRAVFRFWVRVLVRIKAMARVRV
jgi:hypothetical protein